MSKACFPWFNGSQIITYGRREGMMEPEQAALVINSKKDNFLPRSGQAGSRSAGGAAGSSSSCGLTGPFSVRR